MVCLLGCGRMAAMARLLKIGSFQEITPEEAIKQKIAAQIIHNELHDADEANLLEERDMHVFGYRPLTDPLHLVCCNACKKPIKASQYSAHAERCGLSNPLYDALENDDGSSPKKPPKKGKKIIQSTNGNLPVAVVDPDNSVTMDGIGVGGSAPSYGAKLQKKAVIGREVPANASTRYQSEAPTPLATKIYYSHGNHRLRLELQHIFYEMGAKDHGRDSLSPEVEQENDTISSQLPSAKFPYRTTREEFPQTKKDACNLAAMQSSDQMLLQSSELGFEKSRSLPSSNFPNIFCDSSFKT